MSDTSDHDLLVELLAKFDSFYEEFRRVSNGTGFPRCAERLARIEALEKDLDALKARLWWAFGIIATQAVGLIFAAIKGGLL